MIITASWILLIMHACAGLFVIGPSHLCFHENLKNIHVDYHLLTNISLSVYIFQVSCTDMAQIGQIVS